ncbi:hypothetical protein D7030_12310 [Flavobacteriaceae bacterium AU392]|nr:hypothetical protein D1817_12355 [Flavobacteriaceae bacterium]RKM82930.1 hypothetical protein D7030_12310 [Flavobacteriaceae bacterium AU392]
MLKGVPQIIGYQRGCIVIVLCQIHYFENSGNRIKLLSAEVVYSSKRKPQKAIVRMRNET